MADVVLLEVADRVATVTLNRPEARNAMSTELIAALGRLVAEADAAPTSTSSSSPGPTPPSAPAST